MQMHGGKVHSIVEAKIRVMRPQAEISRLPAAPGSWMREARSPSWPLWREGGPRDTLVLDPWFHTRA